MRDVNRIRSFCNELADLWETKVPDWRFGQLIWNLFENDDFFYVEDDKMMEYIQEYFRKNT